MAPRTPILRPDRYFAERQVNGLHMLAVLGVVTVAVLAIFYGIGWIITDNVNGTVEVDNPDRPPEGFCDGDFNKTIATGCEEPRTVTQNVDTVIWSAWNSTAGQVVGAVLVAWILLGILLHVGSWLAGGEHGAVPSFAIAAWGLVPILVSATITLVALAFVIDPTTVTPATQETAFEPIRAALKTLTQLQVPLSIMTAVWSAVIWRYGLEYERELSDSEAWLVAGGVALLFIAAALV